MAALAAGPIFIASFLLAMGIAAASGPPMAIEPDAIGVVVGIMAMSIPFGFAITILPCLVAAMVLTPLARSGVGRLAPVWTIAGAAPIAPLAFLTDVGAPETFALAATGALCALVARRTLLRQLAAA
ncbi:hypothetical protein [Sphingomonas sp. Y38-1Y]|uniref:hypothetical protein n=1 Tax=Sphingomonas sp. Y38-1Y TaxID=3078265 RepID=UPI0028E4873E|nr:hypothetical protein [Sphingomonas sp. Y38-1Y]